MSLTPHTPRTAIVGVAESELGAVTDQHQLRMIAFAARDAILDAGLSLHDIDGLLIAGFPTDTAAVDVAEYLGLQPTFVSDTDTGGSSFELHVAEADLAIQAGLCTTVLIVHASTQRQDRSRSLGGPEEPSYTITSQFDGVSGVLWPVGGYALAASRHMHEFGTTSAQLAEVAVAARQWAQLNPNAFRKEPLTADDVLASPMVSSPLHVRDCCLVNDGGGAVVVTSDERARTLRRPPVSVLGFGAKTTHANIGLAADLVRTGAVESGRAAFEMARLAPEHVDVAQIYDSFTITVLLSLEDLGFCAKGDAGAFVAGGRIAPGGDFPLNTSGGGLSYCHPGRFGLLLLIEGVRQLRGEGGARQVPDANIGLCHGTGGVLSTSVTLLLGKEAR